MRHQNNSLYGRLIELAESDAYPFHMPGHKRKLKGYPLEPLYQIDITELDGFDNLHQPEGMIKNIQDRIKLIYHTEKSFLLVNGSSCGVLSAISACTDRRSMIMLARNSHQSAYHAVFQEELTAIYLYPEYMQKYGLWGRVSPIQAAQMLAAHPECKVVFITSPTYEGIISDIRSIADLVHRNGGVLIVDEAHGAHLKYTGQEEKSAVRLGADIVIQSIHKTLPAPTQTAVLHICSKRVPLAALERYLRIYQSSSPSYILMSGIEECFRIMEEEGSIRYQKFITMYHNFRNEVRELKAIHLIPAIPEEGKQTTEDCSLGMNSLDMGKLVISVKDTSMTGKELYNILLYEFQLQMEMAADTYVLAILTLMDTEDGFKRLAQALLAIDGQLQKDCGLIIAGCQQDAYKTNIAVKSNAADSQKQTGPKEEPMTIFRALNAKRKKIRLADCEGCIAAEYITPYPPGIPLLVPGEKFTDEFIKQIYHAMENGLAVHGIMDKDQVYILDNMIDRNHFT